MLRLDHKRVLLNVSAAIAALLFVSGCSFFSSRPESQSSESRAFRATASADEMPVPLPVEIVDDIQTIAAGGQPKASTAWKTASAEELSNTPSSDAAPPDTDIDPSATTSTIGDDTDVESVASKGADGKYVVKHGDTLMKISFAKYGDVYRWREILAANRKLLGKSSHLTVGTVLKIKGVEYVVIERNGKPYLIRRSDTLVKISRGLYGTPTHWRHLWHNNPQLIHDPNKIYAGFTLYYLDHPSDVSSKVQQASREGNDVKTRRLPAARKRLPASKK